MTDNDSQLRLARIAGAVYFTSFLLVLLTAVDYAASIWPWRPGAVEWRYGAAGLLGGWLLTPLLGVVLALLLATILRSRVALWLILLTGVLTALLLLAVMGLFSLDALQVRASIREDAGSGFMFAVGKSLFKHLTGAIAFLLIGVAARRALKDSAGRDTKSRDTKPLVVGSDR